MFIDLFVTLRKHKVPCSLRELLDLIALLKKGVVFANVEEFYHLAKIVMVKDENHYDKFDNAFAENFEGIQTIDIFDKIVSEIKKFVFNKYSYKMFFKMFIPKKKLNTFIYY